jgi:hypothetical protein
MKTDYPEVFSWFSSVSTNARRVPKIRPWLLPSTYFLTHYSLIWSLLSCGMSHYYSLVDFNWCFAGTHNPYLQGRWHIDSLCY